MAPNFQPGSCDALTAYALGMVVKLLRFPSSSPHQQQQPAVPATKDCKDTPRRDDANAVLQARLEQLQYVLTDPHLATTNRHWLVEQIENAASIEHVWISLDRAAALVAAGDPPADATDAAVVVDTNDLAALSLHVDAAVASTTDIPEALSCPICCSELMLKPVSLACGHSFCSYCLELWLANRATCPTCRFPTTIDAPRHVNVALEQTIASLYPQQLDALASQSQSERFATLRQAIHDALVAGGSDDLQDVLARVPYDARRNNNRPASTPTQQQQEQSLAVSLILEADVELQERVLAAEIHERLRKEKALRESSRRRHLAAYNASGVATHVNPAILHLGNSTTTIRRSSLTNMTNGNNNGLEQKAGSSNSLLTTFLNRK